MGSIRGVGEKECNRSCFSCPTLFLLFSLIETFASHALIFFFDFATAS